MRCPSRTVGVEEEQTILWNGVVYVRVGVGVGVGVGVARVHILVLVLVLVLVSVPHLIQSHHNPPSSHILLLLPQAPSPFPFLRCASTSP
jgi:hypothetical protein